MQAPRGEIVDRHGQRLVENRNSLSIKVTPDKLPEETAERRRVYRRLAKLLGLNPRRLERRVEGELDELPFAKPTVKQDVPWQLIAYVLERQSRFPGVEPEREFLREYPHGPVGAHLFGQVGEVNEKQLKDQRFNGVSLGDRVGQAGIEAEYDRFLRGRNGAARVEVDANGNLTDTLRRQNTQQGSQLRLSLDLDVQRAAQLALAGGTGRGAFAVMDVDNGEVLALGSQPSFDPNIFTKPLSQKRLNALGSEELGKPLFNRAIQGGYPTGSTFKLVTATAALESGHLTPETVLNDPGSLTVGGVTFENAGKAVHGALALRQALTVSSDVFFYQLGQYMDEKGMPLQQWGRRLGIGRKTGIDLPAEEPGPAADPARGATAGSSRSSPTGRGPWATTSTSRSARATCSRTRSRWPWPTRRSPTAGACCGRGSGCASRTPRAGRFSSSMHRPRAAEDLPGEPQRDPRGPLRRRKRAGRNLDAGIRGIPDPNCRKDRNGRARRQGRPVMVRRAGPVSEPQVRRRRDRRGRRLRRRHGRADGAPDPGRAARRA